MNPLKKLLGLIVEKAKTEFGIEIDEKEAGNFILNVLLARIPEDELKECLDVIIKGKMLSEPITDIVIGEAIKELKGWAEEKVA